MSKDDSSSKGTCQNPVRTSSFVKTFAPCSLVAMSLMAGRGSLGSKQIRSLPFFFGTVTMELIHAVGEVTGAMTSCFSRCSKASFTFFLSATGMRRGACCIGSTVLSILMLSYNLLVSV